jgi:hypothetical protein
MRTFRQVLGVTGEGDASVVDHAFVNRCRDDGIEFPGKRPIGRAIQKVEYIARVGRREPAGGAWLFQRAMLDGECARLVPSRASVVGAQFYVQAETARTLGQKITIRKADQLARQLPLGNDKAQLGSDTSWLARRQRDAWELCTQSLYST